VDLSYSQDVIFGLFGHIDTFRTGRLAVLGLYQIIAIFDHFRIMKNGVKKQKETTRPEPSKPRHGLVITEHLPQT
jgi:hypothetical protein